MKNIIRITALCLAMLLSVSMLASCAVLEMVGIGGKSMDKIVEKIKDLDEDDYSYEKASSSEKKVFIEMCEELYDVDLDEGIEAMYNVEGEDSYATVIEFEDKNDAKAFVEGMQEYIDGLDEDDDEEEFALYEDAVLERSGKIVIFAMDDEIVDEIW